MEFIVNDATDASYNLALEEALFERCGAEPLCMIWRNDRSVIIGRNQVLQDEVDVAYAAEHDIRVIRRKTGGGAVYHDPGNINYTIITPGVTEVSYEPYLAFLQEALRTLGLTAEFNGHNDLFVGNRKVSGNAQRLEDKKLLTHGTFLYDIDLKELTRVLTTANSKLAKKGVASVPARVCNVRGLLPDAWETEQMLSFLRRSMIEYFQAKVRTPSRAETARAKRLQETFYANAHWNEEGVSGNGGS